MFRQIYEIALAIFLLQGVLIPVLLVAVGIAWYRQASRLTVLEKIVARDRRRGAAGRDTLLESLPKLDPLHCDGCGSPVALEAHSARCVGCKSLSDLPADYRATMAVRRALARLSAAAIRDWRIARILTSLPMRLFLSVMIVVEPLLFVIVGFCEATFRDTPVSRTLKELPNEVESGLMWLAVCGLIIWAIVFMLLAVLARDLGKKLPVFPDIRRGELRAVEYATCHACGGGIAFRPGSFAGLCPYCTVANFRAAYARRERARSEEQQVLTRASLFGALDIIEGFTGTFVGTMGCASFGFAILVGAAALAAWARAG